MLKAVKHTEGLFPGCLERKEIMGLLTNSLEVWRHISPKLQPKHKATKQDWKDNKILGYIGLFWRKLGGSDVGYSFWEKDTLSPSLGLSYPASSS